MQRKSFTSGALQPTSEVFEISTSCFTLCGWDIGENVLLKCFFFWENLRAYFAYYFVGLLVLESERRKRVWMNWYNWNKEKEVTKKFELTRTWKNVFRIDVKIVFSFNFFVFILMRYEKLFVGRNAGLFQIQPRPTGKLPQFSFVGKKLQLSLRCKVSHMAHFAPLLALQKLFEMTSDTTELLTKSRVWQHSQPCVAISTVPVPLKKKVEGSYMNYYNSIIQLW